MLLSVWVHMGNVTAPPLPLLCLPGKVHPNPLLSNRGVFWHKGGEREWLLCSLGHFSHVLLALFLRDSDMSASFHINWPSHHVKGYATFSLTFRLASSRQDQMYSVHLYSNGSKGILLKILKKPPPSQQLKASFQILKVFPKK